MTFFRPFHDISIKTLKKSESFKYTDSQLHGQLYREANCVSEWVVMRGLGGGGWGEGPTLY